MIGLDVFLARKIMKKSNPKKGESGSQEVKKLAEANEELKSKLAALENIEKEYENQAHKAKELADKLNEAEKQRSEAQAKIQALENDLR